MVPEAVAFGPRQVRERRLAGHLVQQPVPQFDPGRGEHEVACPAVVGVRLTPDETGGLQPVDDEGDVGRFAAHAFRQLARGERGAEVAQGVGLGQRQPQFGDALPRVLVESA
ncbi:hypothetical protein GCM10022243_00430 [Saccharothrix violaceirubra]